MQFKFSFAALAALVAAVFVSAAPAADVETRAAEVDGHVYICTDANWGGDCTNYGFYSGACSNFPSEFQDDISSIGPDSGWQCNVYLDYNCNNDESSLPVTAPGYSSLGWGNDAFSSMQCFRQ